MQRGEEEEEEEEKTKETGKSGEKEFLSLAHEIGFFLSIFLSPSLNFFPPYLTQKSRKRMKIINLLFGESERKKTSQSFSLF